MLKMFCAALSALILAPVGAAASDEAEAIIQTMIEKESQRNAGVDAYVVREDYYGAASTTNGLPNVLLYMKVSDELGFRLVKPAEIYMRLDQEWETTSDQFNDAVWAIRDLLQAIDMSVIRYGTRGDPATEILVGALGAIDNRAGGIWEEFRANNGISEDNAADAMQSMLDMREFASVAKIGEIKKLRGRNVFQLVADGLNRKQVTEDGVYTIQTVTLYVDKQNYVPLHLTVDGESKVGKDPAKPFRIARSDIDHKSIVGTQLYKPYTTSMMIESNFLDDAQKKELEKSLKKLEEYEAQLLDMPVEQQRMMEAMMGGKLKEQIKKMKDMSVGEGVVVESEIQEICIGGVETYVVVTAKTLGMPVEEASAAPLQCTTR